MSRGRSRPRAIRSCRAGQEQAVVEKFDPAAAEAVLWAAIEADDFRAPEAAGEADQEDRAIPQAA